MDAVVDRAWPQGLTRIPVLALHRPRRARARTEAPVRGPGVELRVPRGRPPQRGDYRTTFVGAMPVVVARGEDGEIHAFENRCAHRGALIGLDDGGTVEALPVRLPRLELRPARQPALGIAFERASTARAACPPTSARQPRSAQAAHHDALRPGLRHPVGRRARRSRTTSAPRSSAASGACSATGRLEVIGRFTQALPNNWKLYVENVKDTYHASLLHLFFGTFRITRLTQAAACW